MGGYFANTVQVMEFLCFPFKFSFPFFFLRFYLFIHERQKEAETQAEGEADSPLSREPDVGLDPKTLKS